MKHSVDEETVKQKMRSSFRYRRNMVEDPERCGDVLAEYPRFKDVKGLVSNDFQVDACIYGLNWVMSRDISQWPNFKIQWTYFENRVRIDRFMVSKTTLFPSKIEQDFVELFGEATSNTFKERWPTAFKDKIIAQSKGLHRTAELQELIDVAESSDHVNSDREDMGKDLYIYCSIQTATVYSLVCPVCLLVILFCLFGFRMGQ